MFGSNDIALSLSIYLNAQTNYLNPMSLFIIVSVVFVCMTIFESIVVFKAYLIVQERLKLAGIETALRIGPAHQSRAHSAVVEIERSSASASFCMRLLTSLRARLPHLIYEYLDLVSLIVFPIVYAIAIGSIFHWNGGG